MDIGGITMKVILKHALIVQLLLIVGILFLFTIFYPVEIVSADQQQPKFDGGWDLLSGITIGQILLPKQANLFKLETSIHIVGNLLDQEKASLTVKLYMWKNDYKTTLSGPILSQETHLTRDPHFNTWYLKYDKIDTTKKYFIVFSTESGDKDNFFEFRILKHANYPGYAFLNEIAYPNYAISFMTYYKNETGSIFATIFVGLVLATLIITFYAFVGKSPREKVCLHILTLIAIAILALHSFIIAPADESVNGTAIIGILGSYGTGYSLHFWILKTSLLTTGKIPFSFTHPVVGYESFALVLSPYYFSTLILLLTPNIQLCIRSLIVLHAIIAGISMYMLLLLWKQTYEASLMGSLGYMLSGFFCQSVSQGNIGLTFGYAWAPLVLMFTELAFRKKDVKYPILIGLSLALQMQSGGMVVLFYTIHLLFIYIMYKLLKELYEIEKSANKKFLKYSIKSTQKAVKIVLIAVIFGFLLSAAKIFDIEEQRQFLPPGKPLTVRMAYDQILQKTVYEVSQAYYRDFASAISALVLREPIGYVHGKIMDPEHIFYMGFIFAISLISILFIKKNDLVLFLTFSSVSAIIFATGNRFLWLNIETYLFFLLSHIFRVPVRFLIITQLTVPALASVTISNLQKMATKKGVEKELLTFLLTLILLDLLTFGAYYFSTVPVPDYVYALYQSTVIEYRQTGVGTVVVLINLIALIASLGFIIRGSNLKSHLSRIVYLKVRKVLN